MKNYLIDLSKKTVFFIFILVFSSTEAQISSQSKDSLLYILEKQNTQNRLKTLNKLVSDYYIYNDLDSAGIYANKMLKISLKNNAKFTALAYYNLSLISKYKQKYYPAIDLVKKSILIQQANNLNKDLADSYKLLAGIYYSLNDYNKAIELTFKAIKIYEKINNIEGIVASYNNIGLLYNEMQNTEKALKYYFKAIKIIDKNHINKSKAKLYGNIGVAYKLKKSDSALYYYKLAINDGIIHKDKYGLCSNYFNLGNLYAFYLKNKDSAENYYNKSIILSKKYNKRLLPSIYSSMGKMYYEYKNYKKSIEYSNKSLELATKYRDLSTKEISNFYLYTSYKSLNKPQKSIRYLEDFVDIRDTIYNNKSKISLENLEAKYENEKNKIKIELLKTKNKKNILIEWLLGIAFFSSLVLLYLFYRNHKYKQKQILLEKENLNQQLHYKTKQLTSQALMMIQKNKLVDDILKNISNLKELGSSSKQELNLLKRKLKKTIHSEDDWELFKHYFEEINRDFFDKLKQISPRITPAEFKLSALIKLGFNIKETALLLNQSPDSVKTARYTLRKKLNLKKGENIYDFLNGV